MPEAQFRRIEADLKRRIEAGEWAPGTRLPVLVELAAQYGVSVQPVKTALGRLEARGLVVLRRGGSAIVAERPTSNG